MKAFVFMIIIAVLVSGCTLHFGDVYNIHDNQAEANLYAVLDNS